MAGANLARWLALTLSALTSFCGLGYQQVLALALSDASSDYVLSQSISLGLFLLGMGLGALLSERCKEGVASLLTVEWLLSLSGLLSPIVIRGVEILLRLNHWPASPLLLFALTAPMVLWLGLLTGFELPLLLRASPQTQSASVLATGYGGAFLGATIVPMFLFPSLDVQGTALALGIFNLIAASLLLVSISRWQWMIGHFALCGLLIASAFGADRISKLHLQAIYFGTPQLSEWLGDVLRLRTRYQWIDILPPEFSEGVQGRQDFQIYLDRKIQLSSSTIGRYHESMAFGGANLLGRPPERILVLGGGDGLLAATLLKIPTVKHIDLVELDDVMIDLARHQRELTALNERSLFDSKVKVHVDDAFQFVRESKNAYDLILIDLPFPYSYELSLLYSKEFYQMVARRLTEDGVIVLDFPLPGGRQDHLPILISTLKAAGLKQPFAFGTEDFFVAVSPRREDLAFDLSPLISSVSDQTLTNLIHRPPESVDSNRVNSVYFPVWFKHLEEGRNQPQGLQIVGSENAGYLSLLFPRLERGFSEIFQVPDSSWTASLRLAWLKSLHETRDFTDEIRPGVSWPRFQLGFEGEKPAFQWFDRKEPKKLRAAWNASQCIKDASPWIGVYWTSDLSLVEFYSLNGEEWEIRRYRDRALIGVERRKIESIDAPDVTNPLRFERAQAWREKIQSRFLILPRSITHGPLGERVLYP